MQIATTTEDESTNDNGNGNGEKTSNEMRPVVWIDGHLVDGEGGVSPLDHGLLYGDGVFEGIRYYGGAAFRLAAHLARLERSAAALRLALPGGRAAMDDAVRAVIAGDAAGDGYVRLVVTRGRGALGIDPRSCPRPSVIAIRAALTVYPSAARGLRAIVATTRQTPPDVLDPRVKSLNYLPRAMARVEAREAGADEAIMLNHRGLVAEATTENVFVAKDGVLRTPPAIDGALEGITRAVVLELAAAAGLPAVEASLAPYDLYTADEVFLCGTAAELVAVRTIDGRAPSAACPGPLFTRLAAAFRALVARETAAARAA